MCEGAQTPLFLCVFLVSGVLGRDVTVTVQTEDDTAVGMYCSRVLLGTATLTGIIIFTVRFRFDSRLSCSLLSTEVFFQKLSLFRSYRAEKAIIRNEAYFLFEDCHSILSSSCL